jgi:hypothetical protein
MPPNGDALYYTIIDEVRQFQDRSKSKVIVLQLVRFEDRRHEIRVGYYIIGKKPRMSGRWVWGEYAAFMPVGVFRRVVRKAIARGWFSKMDGYKNGV